MSSVISHSKVSKYLLCPQAYAYHYIDKIRPTGTTGALLFGSALDNALNLVLKKESGAEVMFEKSFTNVKINDKETYLPTSIEVVYANADFDSDLLTEEDYSFIKDQVQKGSISERGDILEGYKDLSNQKKDCGFDSFDDEEKAFFNLMNWLSMRRKGYLMLDAYRRKVMPKIEKVHAIQEYIELTNEAGDKVIGYVDLVADIKGMGTVILDNKTSAREYASDSVLTSPQLSLYMHALEEKYSTRKAGYIVMMKTIMKNRKKVCKSCGFDGSGSRHKSCNNEIDGKRCGGDWEETIKPDCYIDIITDDIPKKTEELVMENIDQVNENIKCGRFYKNLNSCTNFFGGNCPYLSLCYRGQMSGLKDFKK